MDSERSIAVLIPDGDSIHALAAVRCLAAVPGIKSFILYHDRGSLAPYSRWTSGAKRIPKEHGALLTAVTRWAAAVENPVLLPIGEDGTRFALDHQAALAGRLALPPLPDSAMFDLVGNKLAFQQFSASQGLPVPPAAALNANAAQQTGFPALLKPVNSSAGRGIRLLHEPDDLQRHLDRIPEEKRADYMVQRYIPGEDFDFAVICRAGQILAYSAKRRLLPASQSPFRPQTSMMYIDDPALEDLANTFCRALDWNGLIHFDLIHGTADGKFWLLEANPRMWVNVLGSLTVGANFPHLLVLSALGQTYPPPANHQAPYLQLKPALAEGGRRLFGRSRLPPIPLHQTEIWFDLRDPLPTLLGQALNFGRNLIKKVRRRF